MLVKDKCNGFGYSFSTKYFYVFMTAHEYKHFNDLGGTGLRNLVDRYVFLRHFSDRLDITNIKSELSKLQIKEYEYNARELSLKLINGVKLTKNEKELLDCYIFSGTYGTLEKTVENRLNKKGKGHKAKIKYFASRLGVPISKNNPSYKLYAAAYPKFYNNKQLLIFLPIYRLFRGLKYNRNQISTEIKTLMKI